MGLWSALSLLPDVDVIGFRFGVRYADAWGHRGATHSLCFAFVLGALIGLLGPLWGASRTRTAAWAIALLISHGLLDTLTDGGLGCALLWPLRTRRYFAPFQPIPVAPIGRAFFSSFGLHVALRELLLFLPFWLYALWPRARVPASDSALQKRRP